MRVATLNVHGMASYRDMAALLLLVKTHRITILGLQEVPMRTAELIGRTLNYYVYTYPDSSNALITKDLPVSVEKHIMKWEEFEKRSAIKACYSWGCLMVTHLDHLSEDARLAQLRQLNLADVDILMGDLNSSWSVDYTPELYSRISRSREVALLEEPRDDVIDYLLSLSFIVHLGESTCPYGTRVDYILTRRPILNYYTVDTIQSHLTDHKMVVAIV